MITVSNIDWLKSRINNYAQYLLEDKIYQVYWNNIWSRKKSTKTSEIYKLTWQNNTKSQISTK